MSTSATLVSRSVARVVALRRGALTRIMPQRERWLDAGIAVALAGVNAVSLLPYQSQLHPFWLALTLVVAQAIPLAWRRAHPVGVALTIGAARVSYDALGFGFAPFPLGPAIAFYTIIDRCGPLWRRISCLILAAGVAVSQTTPGHSQPYETIFQALIFLTAYAAGVLTRTARANLAAEADRADRAEAELDRQAARAAAAERTRIARELHDVVAHHVSLIAVQAEAASSLLPGRPEQARRSVEVIGDTARQALIELRRLLGVLRGPAGPVQTTPSASLADLPALLVQVRDAGLHVDFDTSGAPFPLAPSIDLTAYRIVQEALTNTLRHAGAARAAVSLCYEPGFITVRITDSDGSAHPPQALADPLASSGFGLAGIAERVASCGGNLTVGPTAADGFAVAARLPAS